MPKLDRRQLILGGTALGASLLIYWQTRLTPGDLQNKLLEIVGGKADLRAPDTTGSIDEELMDTLWLLFKQTGMRWQLWESVNLDQPAFVQIIRVKTRQKPSYLTEYEEAGQLLNEIEPDWQQNDATFDQLFRLPVNVYDFNTTRLGRMQKFVIEEFIELLVAFGGFRAFGYQNYRGFVGGPLSDLTPLPYRPL